MKPSFTEEEWNTCLKVLNELKDNPLENPNNLVFKGLITKIHKNAKKAIQDTNHREIYPNGNIHEIFISDKNKKIDLRDKDISVLLDSEIAKIANKNTSYYTDNISSDNKDQKVLHKKISCYVCKEKFDRAHFFYNRLCPECADFNYRKRFTSIDLSNRNAIITGGRVKIGYATSLRLLRMGANVIMTSRFPALTLNQLEKENDYLNWKDRVIVYGLDLRNLHALDEFISFIKEHFQSLDILINNAAQTIKYPDEHYIALNTNENILLNSFNKYNNLHSNKTPITEEIKLLDNNKNELIEYKPNRFGQPIDNRIKNSWNSKLEEIDTYELLEVNLINHISPYILIRELKPLFLESTFDEKFIINVTSTEGQFSYSNKTIYHPHTNMTKAALNMMTKTSAEEFALDKIYMNSVDVGWVSTGAIEPLRQKQFKAGYIPPLDSVDGAARIFHPIEEVINNNKIFYGVLLKDYKVVNW